MANEREFTLEELQGTATPKDKEFSFEELTGQKPRPAPAAPKEMSFMERLRATEPFELPIKEFARGAALSPQRAGAAMAQFVPSKREEATQRAQEIEAELSESFPKRAGATVADIIGIGKLASPIIKGVSAGQRMLRAGGVGAGVTAATTPVEKETENVGDFIAEKAKQGAIGFGFGVVPQGVIEGTRKFLFPGSMLTANQATKEAVDRAVKEGYLLPISEITDSAALQTLDRLFDSPLVQRNAPLFARQINKMMGAAGDEISPRSLEKLSRGLSAEIIKLTRNKEIDLSSITPQLRQIYVDTLQAIPDLEPAKLKKIVDSLGYSATQNVLLDGKTWHETRQLLQNEARKLMGQPGYQQARDLIRAWDNAAFNSIKDPAWKGAFSNWKGKYTVFSDVEAAVNANPTAKSNFVKGVLDPEDLRNAISMRRPEEFTRRMFRPTTGARAGREQTALAGVAGGLNVFGRQPESVAPYYRAATAPKVFGTLVGAKALQDYLYSPAGQQALMQGLSPNQLRSLTSAMQPFATDIARFAAREASSE